MSKKETINVVWLSGNNTECQKIIDSIKQFLKTFEYYSYGNDVTIEFLEQELTSFSCFEEEEKLIVLTDFPISKGKNKTEILKKLKKILETLPENCNVIFNNFKTDSKSFISFIKKIGKIYTFDKYVDKNNAIKCITEYVGKKDKSIDTEAINIIIDSISVTGDKNIDIDKIFNNLTKILSYIGSRQKINKQDVLNVCDRSDDFIIWELFNYLDKKNYKGCLSILQKIENNEKNFNETISQIFRTINWRYKLLLFIKEAKAKKYSNEQIILEASKLYKFKQSGSSYNITYEIEINKDGSKRKDYTEKMITQALEGNYYSSPLISYYKRQDLFYILRSIAQVFLKIRTGCSDLDIKTTVISIFKMICHVDSENNLSNIREISDTRLKYFG